MPYDLSTRLVIGVSSRALFDLELENKIFEEKGVDEYRRYQIEHEEEILRQGAAFPLVKGLLALNDLEPNDPLVEVVVMSRNSPDSGLLVFNSIDHFALNITRAAFTGGRSLADYLSAFSVDLFLSRKEADVQAAVDGGVAAAILADPPDSVDEAKEEIRIAFDGDAVLFSDESERIFQEQGLEAFLKHEKEKRNEALPEGPFAKLLLTLSKIQSRYAGSKPSIRVAVVTARNSPAHMRVIKTLRTWGVHIDEGFFLGGVSKGAVLKAFKAHIFFDDQEAHVKPASRYVPSGQVPIIRTRGPTKLLERSAVEASTPSHRPAPISVANEQG